MRRALRFAQRDGQHLQAWKLVEHRFRQLFVGLAVELAALHVGFGVNAERQLHVFFVGDPDVDVGEQLRHHLVGFPAPLPEVFAIVQIAAYGEPVSFRGRHAFHGERGRGLTDRRRNTGDVEPVRAFEDMAPMDCAGLGQGNGRVVAVVGDGGRPLIRARFDVVDAHAPFAAHDVGGIDAQAAQFANTGFGRRMLVRQDGDVARGQAESGDGDSGIGLAAPESGHQFGGLKEALHARRGQPQHDFAKGHNKLRHWNFRI